MRVRIDHFNLNKILQVQQRPYAFFRLALDLEGNIDLRAMKKVLEDADESDDMLDIGVDLLVAVDCVHQER